MQIRYVFPDGKGGERYEYATANSEAELRACLKRLVDWNVAWLRAHPDTTPLYESEIVYEQEPPPREDWQTIPINFQRGNGDCEDLASHRAAELIVSGEDPGAHCELSEKDYPWGRLWHVQVGRTKSWGGMRIGADLEDPSRERGMR